MTNKKTNIFIGTELKLNIHIEPIGSLSMSDYDWEADVYCSAKSVLNIKKEQAVQVDDNNYILLVDTEKLGAGRVKCKIAAYIPDEDFEDGIRNEVCGIDTGIDIVKNI